MAVRWHAVTGRASAVLLPGRRGEGRRRDQADRT